ncbi:MAG: hypothetical protein V1712_02570 [Patescibacteria group bacterium]
MNGLEHNHHEITEEKAPDAALAKNLIIEWEAQTAIYEDEENRPNLARTMLDTLEKERPNRNEKEMLNLVRALRDNMDLIQLRDKYTQDQVSEDLKRLNEQFEQYKSIEQV